MNLRKENNFTCHQELLHSRATVPRSPQQTKLSGFDFGATFKKWITEASIFLNNDLEFLALIILIIALRRHYFCVALTLFRRSGEHTSLIKLKLKQF